MDNRICEHVVLNVAPTGRSVTITVDGRQIEAYEGEPILAALLASGIRINRYTVKRHEPRGLFCGIGQCSDCSMVVDGKANVRTCITPVKEGMVIFTQDGLSEKKEAAS
ncbi:MAG: (2Fe-2S)-binding protein [Lachnospiraceae bacterium]|nr:(2Fe-2S)-binding protein [Lachnospiraceae bacterium]MDD6551720.1 (2Fe-2S)-binding protein [Lachnospiraceae bacterium]